MVEMPGACGTCKGNSFLEDRITPCPTCSRTTEPRSPLSPSVQSVITNRGNPMAAPDPGSRRAAFTEKYGGNSSVGDPIMQLCQAGMPEEVAANAICGEYVAAHRRSDGSVGRQSWLDVGRRMLRELHASKHPDGEGCDCAQCSQQKVKSKGFANPALRKLYGQGVE